MINVYLAVSVTLFILASRNVCASQYTIQDNYFGHNFLSGFDHIAISDPTHGRVSYVTQSFATSENLTFTTNNTFVMRADHWSVLHPQDSGRNSIRIQSKKQYSNGVMVLDVRHMPEGCGTWPAFWTTDGDVWPNQGEIDILEGVNDQMPNHSTLHTSSGCSMVAGTMKQTGILKNADCNANLPGNMGCGVENPTLHNYGPMLNAVGGGWYVMERTPSVINMWFWARNDTKVPSEISTPGSKSLDPSQWKQPYANFVSQNSCDIEQHFGAHNIIFNLSLCGDWAGSAYPSTCPLTCVDHVNQNPDAFKDAYWDIGGLRTYSPIKTPKIRQAYATTHRLGRLNRLPAGHAS